MPSRYVTRALFIHRPWDEEQVLGGEMVFEQEPGPCNTGLLNAEGLPLYRMSERAAIGFDLRRPMAKGKMT